MITFLLGVAAGFVLSFFWAKTIWPWLVVEESVLQKKL